MARQADPRARKRVSIWYVTGPVPPSSDASAGPAHREGDILAEKYRLIRRVGRGAHGTVWTAENLALAGQVAVKTFAVKTGTGSLERFLREARTMAKLNHPAVARVFDFGQTPDGDPFIVMELLDGEDLETFLAREGGVDAMKAVQLALPLVEALVAVHANGIVHRDIKPGNVFLAKSPSGHVQPKLLDFGIAKQLATGSALTLDGTVIGTAQYMSPEQVEGRDVDERSDLWSFSVVLYEILTGRRPFDRPSQLAVMRSIVDEDAPAVAHDRGIDDALIAILAKGMTKEPAARWSSARDLGRALAEWLSARGVFEDVCGASLNAKWLEGSSPRLPIAAMEGALPTATSPHRGRAGRWVTVAALALALAAALVWSQARRAGTADARQPDVALTETRTPPVESQAPPATRAAATIDPAMPIASTNPPTPSRDASGLGARATPSARPRPAASSRGRPSPSASAAPTENPFTL